MVVFAENPSIYAGIITANLRRIGLRLSRRFRNAVLMAVGAGDGVDIVGAGGVVEGGVHFGHVLIAVGVFGMALGAGVAGGGVVRAVAIQAA